MGEPKRWDLIKQEVGCTFDRPKTIYYCVCIVYSGVLQVNILYFDCRMRFESRQMGERTEKTDMQYRLVSCINYDLKLFMCTFVPCRIAGCPISFSTYLQQHVTIIVYSM